MENKQIGFKCCVGRNKASSFNYFLTFNEAWLWVMEQVQQEYSVLKQVNFDISIKQIELKNCKCGQLIEITETECLSCDKIRGDFVLELEDDEK